VDKPAGWTSHDVVARCRRIYGQRRIGHSGTLDPGATGLLLVGLGRATRLLRFLTALPKRYEGEIVLGVATSTLDDAGDVVSTSDLSHVTAADVEAAARSLTGDILQVPPMVSAVRVGGRRLHELARAGEEVERAARPVTVSRFDVAPTADPLVWKACVTCSSGTFVRVLAADVGVALGGGAHLRNLRRTGIGSHAVEDATPLAELETDRVSPVMTPARALADYPVLTVADDVAVLVGHGRPLSPEVLGASGAGPWALLDGTGTLLAVYEDRGRESLLPAVVL
jgi:tRNA pseudouridine55 synthase